MQFADALARAKPATRAVTVVLDGEVGETIDGLERDLRDAQNASDTLSDGRVAGLEAALADARTRAAESEVEFRFQAIGSLRWGTLLAEHPPTKEDRELGSDHNPRTFGPAAVAASLIEPEGVTVEQVTELVERLSFGQWLVLWQTCLAVNLGVGDLPKSVRRSAVALTSAVKPTTSANGDSLAASS